MPYQNLSGTIPAAVVAEITTKLNEVKTALQPFVVNLTPEERGTLYKMGDERYGLVQKTITVCDTTPAVVPAFVSLANLKDDYNAYGQMAPMLLVAQQIAESLGDTMMARGSEALTQGTKPVYAAVKAAREQNVAEADAAFELLNPFYDLPDRPDGGS